MTFGRSPHDRASSSGFGPGPAAGPHSGPTHAEGVGDGFGGGGPVPDGFGGAPAGPAIGSTAATASTDGARNPGPQASTDALEVEPRADVGDVIVGERGRSLVYVYNHGAEPLWLTGLDLAAEANAAPAKTDHGMQVLLDRYLRYRATGASGASGEDAGDGKLQRVRVQGHINFDEPGRWGDPFRFAYSDVRIGRFEAGDMSATMSDHVRGKSLADVEGTVEIAMVLAHRSGSGAELRLHRDRSGSVTGASNDERVVAAGGAAGVWEVLAKWPLGKHWVT